MDDRQGSGRKLSLTDLKLQSGWLQETTIEVFRVIIIITVVMITVMIMMIIFAVEEGVLNVNKNLTRCNSMQIFIYCKATLHVSGVTAPIIRSTKDCNRSLRYRS